MAWRTRNGAGIALPARCWPLTLALLGLIAFAPAAGAATINVTSTADNKTNDQLCTLREAVDAVNTNAPVNPAGGNDCPAGQPHPTTDTIVLASATYALTGAANENNNASGDLDISPTNVNGPVVIDGQGAGATTIDPNDSDRAIELRNAGTAIVRDLTVTDGSLTNGAGAGIQAGSTDLTLTNVAVTANQIAGTVASSMHGAGIDVGVGGSLTVSGSSIGPDNQIVATAAGAGTVRGAGVNLASSAVASIDRSTLEDNVISGTASQTLLGGALSTLDSEEDLTITNSTVNDNAMTGGGTQQGGGVLWDESGGDDELVVENSTFEGNTVGSGQNGGAIYAGGPATVAFATFGPTAPADMNGAGLYDAGVVQVRASLFETGTNDDCGGGVPASLGFNVEKTGNDCFFNQPTDVLSSQALLSPAGLDDNGGPTMTHALRSSASDALDHVPPPSCIGAAGAALTQDQRGAARPFDFGGDSGPQCDVGAFERVDCGGEPVNVIGTPADDTLNGTPGNDVFLGLGGADEINLGAGADFACAGPGDDTIHVAPDPTFDDLRGEAGSDTVSFSGFPNPVTIDLPEKEANSPALEPIFLNSIENATGGSGADTMTGDGGLNRLDGGPGDDTETGGGGVDTLLGNLGDDDLLARDGLHDVVDCGSGAADSAQTDRLSLDSVSGCEAANALPEPGDTDPPETTIDKGPKKKVKTKKKKAKAKFIFSADEQGASFECSLDQEAFAPCSSPLKEKVKKGKHGFEVRAIDAAGNVDPTPDSHAWKVKRKRRR